MSDPKVGVALESRATTLARTRMSNSASTANTIAPATLAIGCAPDRVGPKSEMWPLGIPNYHPVAEIQI